MKIFLRFLKPYKALCAFTLLGSFLCARLSARLGRDMRNALYDKSLAFSAYDFEQFGTGSMITRTLNDVNIVQQAFIWTIQMILPVPMMCIIGVIMAFSIDRMMEMLMIGMTGRLNQVPAPADYKRPMGINYKSGFQVSSQSKWGAVTVTKIWLQNISFQSF